MSDVNCLNCREPWELHHMMHDLIKDVIMDHGLWPDLREDLLGPLYPDENDKSRKAAAAAAKRAEKKLATRWYKPLKAGKLAKCPDVLAAFERADWMFVNGNVGRILRCSCCEDPYVPLQNFTLEQLRSITTGHADDCYADNRVAMLMVASDPGRKDMPCWLDMQEDVAPVVRLREAQKAPDHADVGCSGPYAVVLTGGGEALGIPVPWFNPVYFYRSNIVAENAASCRDEGWRHWYIRNLHCVAMVEYQDDVSLGDWRDTKNPPKEFGTFADFLSSKEFLHG